jgi:hypothetical protein
METWVSAAVGDTHHLRRTNCIIRAHNDQVSRAQAGAFLVVLSATRVEILSNSGLNRIKDCRGFGPGVAVYNSLCPKVGTNRAIFLKENPSP